jgi:uncharacterized repeat protein (TIGR04138 family)
MNNAMTKLQAIREKDPRYDIEAYLFIREALEFTSKTLKKPQTGPLHHVTGRELAEGVRDLALQQFGPLAFKVLSTWGIRRTEDIGSIVFNLVDAGELGKTAEDKHEDFADGYDFHDTFATPFLARNPPSSSETPSP